METWSSVPRTLDSGEPQMPGGLQSEYLETSLAVQWLRFGAFIARGLGSVPGQGIKIPQASLCSQKKKKKKILVTRSKNGSSGFLTPGVFPTISTSFRGLGVSSL